MTSKSTEQGRYLLHGAPFILWATMVCPIAWSDVTPETVVGALGGETNPMVQDEADGRGESFVTGVTPVLDAGHLFDEDA